MIAHLIEAETLKLELDNLKNLDEIIPADASYDVWKEGDHIIIEVEEYHPDLDNADREDIRAVEDSFREFLMNEPVEGDTEHSYSFTATNSGITFKRLTDEKLCTPVVEE